MKEHIEQGPVDVIVGLLFGLKVPVVSSHWKLEFSEAFAGPMFRLCATIYHPTQPPPYNETTWYSKIAAVVVFRRAVLSVRLRRLTPNAALTGAEGVRAEGAVIRGDGK